MKAHLLDGQILANEILIALRDDVERLQEQDVYPCLAVCLVGEDPASEIYVRHKQRACEKVGIRSVSIRLSAKATTHEIMDFVKDWNEDPNVHGILVQLPLPEHVDRYTILSAIDPRKDVDGFHPANVGSIPHGRAYHKPCTPQGIQTLLSHYGVDLDGKNVIIVNRSIVVGQPLALMLGQPLALMLVQDEVHANATVTIAHDHTRNLPALTRKADVVIVAVGRRPEFVLTADMVKRDAVVVDVGINRIAGKVIGDVDFEAVRRIAAWITPCPGGVGPLTIATLLQNTVQAARLLNVKPLF